MLIKDLLRPGLKTIAPEATVIEASKLMNEFKIRHLLVSDGKDAVGMLSDRDVLLATNKVAISKSSSELHINKHKKVSEFMSSPVIKMKISAEVQDLIKEILDKKLSSIIIEDESKNEIGIITTEDLLILLLNTLDQNKKVGHKIADWFFK